MARRFPRPFYERILHRILFCVNSCYKKSKIRENISFFYLCFRAKYYLAAAIPASSGPGSMLTLEVSNVNNKL